MIDALASDDGYVRDEAALFLLKHDPGMTRAPLTRSPSKSSTRSMGATCYGT